MTEALVFANREEWLAAKRKNIGGSEIAALFGMQAPYQMSHYALWQEKSGRIKMPEVDGERPAWGLRLETAIAEGAAEKYGWTIEKGGYIQHPTVAGMACTLDFVITGYIAAPRENVLFPAALEVKNVDWMVHKQQWGEEPPIHVQLQLQHQLACTGYLWGNVIALIGGNKLAEPYQFTRRPNIIAEIERRVTAFWQSITDKKEPPVDGTESTAAALAEMFPEALPGSSIDLGGDNEGLDAFANLKQARLDRKAAEAAERAAKNILATRIGKNEIVRIGDQIIATYKTVRKKSYVVKESIYRQLSLKDD